MKTILLLLFLISCSQKYQTYHVIDKNHFRLDSYSAPIAPPLIAKKKERTQFCRGQFFFFNNAKKETNTMTEQVIKGFCPNSNYFLNAKITETWWTTIFYSRSCVKIDGFCP